MDSKVHLPSFPSLHRKGTKHKNGSSGNSPIINSGSSIFKNSDDINQKNESTIDSSSIPYPREKLISNGNSNSFNNSKNIISRTVTSAINNSDRPHLKLSNKLRHSSTNYVLSNVITNHEPLTERSASTNSNNSNNNNNNNNNNSLSINSPTSFTKSPKISKPRISSKSSSFSVTVDLPTIRPGAGLKKQRNLSRINTLFGEDMDRSTTNQSYSSSNSLSNDESASDNESSSSNSESIKDTAYNNDSNNNNNNEEAEAEILAEISKEPILPNSHKNHYKNLLNRTKTVRNSNNDYFNLSNSVSNILETESEDDDYNNNSYKTKDNPDSVKIDEISKAESDSSTQNSLSLSKIKHNRLSLTYNDRSLTSDLSDYIDIGHSKRPSIGNKNFRNSLSSENFKNSNFFLSETNDLLSHRIKLLDDLHMNPTTDEILPKLSQDKNIDEDEDKSMSSNNNSNISSQMMKPSPSDLSVLTNLPNSKNLKSSKRSLDINKYDTKETNNPIQMSEALFEKHPTMTMKHYIKIMNRAKHVKAYLNTYYAVLEQYQKIRHPNKKTGESIYPGVDGIWNPLQIMRNRRVRMRTGEKLKKFTMHGQKVGVGELLNLNNSLTNLTTEKTSSIPLELINTNLQNQDIDNDNNNNNGLGILTAETEDLFQRDWRKVKIASKVFSRHEKQRLIWQIGLHEIIGDLIWRENKWGELRDPSGKRWFPKYSIDVYNHKYSTSVGIHHHLHDLRKRGDSINSKEQKFDDSLVEGENIIGDNNIEKDYSLKKLTKKEEEDYIGSGGEKKHKRISLKTVAKGKIRDKEKEKEKDKDKEFEREDDKEKERTSSLRRKSDNLASVARFKHYEKKSNPISISPAKNNNDQLGIPFIKVEKSISNTMSDENNNGAIVTTTHSNNSNNSYNSNNLASNNKSEICSSLVSDVGFYDAMDEVFEFMRLTRCISGYIESNKYEMLIKEFTVHKQLEEGRNKLNKKIESIEKLENESLKKHSELLKMVEEIEIEVEKHRSFTGIKANKIEELLGYCDRTNGEINTSIALKIRNLNERADGISIQCENKVFFEYIYKIAETSIVGILWLIWIVVEMWLWCKWGFKTIVGIVKWVLI